MKTKRSGLQILGTGLLVLAIIAAVFFFFRFHLGQYLTLESLKANRESLEDFYHRHSLALIGAYFMAYVLVAALSLPGATVLTLAGGAIFGVFLGTLVVSFASSIGATVAFLVSRLLLHKSVQSRFGESLKGVNEGFRKEGAFYLFTLRLIPIFPFFVVNLLMGVTPMNLWTYYWVSQIGMFPGTIAYVNAGTQLSRITSFKQILSPPILLSFAALGILPLVAKKLVGFSRARRKLRKFRKPKAFDYNLVVVGAGSGGLVAAYIAAAVKAKVALVEKHRMGGDCLNTGCVPSKALLRSAKMLSYSKRARDFGFKGSTIDFDFKDVMERVQAIIRKIEPHDSIQRYTELGVECISGEARIKTPYEIQVGDRTLRTKNIVIATGASPALPRIPGIQETGYFTTDTIWSLKTLPKRLLILGGGPIGCEMAQAFQRLGAQVTLIERDRCILPREDEDASTMIRGKLEAEGVRILLGHLGKEFKSGDGSKSLICEAQGQEVKIEFDEVLLALGRVANVKGFGLEELGVEISRTGTIAVDEYVRATYPNIYACGDVAGPYQFTHFASHQAWYASVNALFGPFKKFRADYRVIPWATFTDPEVARVGLNEKEAKEKGIAYSVTRYDLDDLDRAIADSEDHGFVKVLTVPGKDRILGATIVGAHAADYIPEYVTAMKHGLGMNRILGTIHIYPTLAEANKFAAGNWKKANTSQAALNGLRKFHSWRRS